MAIQAHCYLKSVSPYSQSRPVQSDKKPQENPVDYEERTWMERCHVDDDGMIFIPPMAFANSIKEAAKYAAIPIPGKARSLYTKHFAAGVMVVDPLVTDTSAEDVIKEKFFVPSDGVPGGGKRVWKNFPMIQQWEGGLTVHISDPAITEDVFRQVMGVAGSLIGVGRFRPRNRGYYGRYQLVNLEWESDA